MCGRTGVVAVQEQALVHADDPAALPQVVIEEEQVLGHTLRVKETVSTHGNRPCPFRAWRRGLARVQAGSIPEGTACDHHTWLPQHATSLGKGDPMKPPKAEGQQQPALPAPTARHQPRTRLLPAGLLCGLRGASTGCCLVRRSPQPRTGPEEGARPPHTGAELLQPPCPSAGAGALVFSSGWSSGTAQGPHGRLQVP